LIRRAFIFLALIATSFLAHTDIPQWQILPEQSSLSFTATQNGAPVTGQFKQFTGIVYFDPNDLKNSKATIIVDISSVNTTYTDLTSTLLNSEWFNAKLFPKAEFKSSGFIKTGINAYQANGNLTIRNKTQPVVLNFTAEENPANHMKVEGSALLKRSDFGVGQGEWASTKEILDEVKVNFKLTAKKG
jgi:polyisoprenoid-binding protein YceI